MVAETMNGGVYTPRQSILDSQQNQIEVTERIWNSFPVGREFNSSVELIAQRCESTYNIVSRLVTLLDEECHVIRRRTTWEGQGRRAHFTLLVPKDEAVAKLRAYHQQIILGNSLKSRIVEILSQGKTYSTTKELSQTLALSGGSSQLHGLTHVLHSLKRENRITFKMGPTKDDIPYDIRAIGLPRPESKSSGEVERVSPVAEIKEIPVMVPESTPSVIAAPEASTKPTEASTDDAIGTDFPLITKLIQKMTLIEAAAKLAAEAGEEDITIMLQERHQMDAFQREAISLYNAYLNCKK